MPRRSPRRRHARADPGRAPGPACIADVIFQTGDRIRSLRDGRVLFDVVEQHFPRARMPYDGNVERPESRQLFSLDLAQVGVPPVRLIAREQLEDDTRRFFDVSPDRARVIYSTALGRVWCLAIDQGRAERLQLPLDGAGHDSLEEFPRIVWSGPDAFTYLRWVDGRPRAGGATRRG